MNSSFLPQEHIRELFLWYAEQDFVTQKNVFQQKQLLFRNSEKKGVRDLALLDFRCFCQAVTDGGWKEEQDYRQGKTVSEEAARQISIRRGRRAKNIQAHRVKVRNWLHKNWGKVLEYRRAELGWRRVSQMIKTEYGITISHTTLVRYDRRFDQQMCCSGSRKTGAAFYS